MPEKRAAAKSTKKSASRTDASAKSFTADEKAAMRERAKELKAAASGAEAERAVVEKIGTMTGSDRVMAKRVHAIVKETAPFLTSRLWYGMPAYAKNGTTILFFQDAAKFKSRYATLGFLNDAKLDEGAMWPTSFALTELGPTEEAKVRALVKKAAS
jgi:uncharacterized protein YdhG (YjbR/CyaY superfamily)